jgi:ATP-dependent Clp protease ATP-binding subunit ClpA
VFGRDREIRQMIDILGRRRKNNPIVVGEPGVGKTAVVEGLALRIVEGDVPELLKNVRLLSLDLGSRCASSKATCRSCSRTCDSCRSISDCCRPAQASRASSRIGSRT